ncbi:unknown [Clostridium sp. CAG:306]|nr:unknown [Clostridium sp. CAG:306]
MIFESMKKLFTITFVLLTAVICLNAQAFAVVRKPPTVLVLTDSGHRNGTNYIICGAASDIIAEDIINELNKTKRIKAPLLGENMAKITQKTLPLYHLTFFKEYKYNYNVDFVNLKRVTANIPADYILMVTSGLDIQSQFLKETWWNKWGISASEPVVPTYRLTTMLTLIDKRTYSIVWQDLYQRDLKAENADIAITQFSPSYAQLAKIKKYSKTMSEYVTMNIDKTVNPWIVPPKEPTAIEMRSRFLNEGTKLHYPAVNEEVVKQNFNEFKTDTKQKWNTYQRQRMQKKHIENVRRIEKRQEAEKIKQQTQIKKQTKPVKKQEERLFDSIRNNIDDMSNTLPPPTEQEILKERQIEQLNSQPEKTQTTTKTEIKKETDKNIKPAVEVLPAQKKEEPKLLKPVMNKPVVKQATPKTQEPKEQEEKKHVPYYDWNLKNIYLEKIGKMSHLE